MRKDYNLEKRRYVVSGFILVIAVIYLVRLFSLQVADDKYKVFAENNAFLRKVQYPSRGLMYDRNGELVVYNQPAYDVMMIPKDIKGLDTLDFCHTLGITRENFDARMAEVKRSAGYSVYTPQRFMSHLTARDYGRLQEKLYRYAGFYTQKRILRQYNYRAAANVLGNIREVNQKDLDKDEEGYYRPGDYTGDVGVESSYEEYLRGVKGVEILMRDAHGRIQGRYEEGAYDVAPRSGRNLTLGLDIKLQQYAESLMVNKIGAVVAIEPKTGEILCMVSSPTYDPTLLVGRERGKNYLKLQNREENPDLPLFDRALSGVYPPGSTFKPTQALITLQEGIIDINTPFPCYHGYAYSGRKLKCHGHPSPLPVRPALATSCNAFFCWGFKNMIDRRSKYGSVENAFEIWKNYLVQLGYGYKLGVDLPHESRGFLPNAKYYDKYYGAGHWSANTIISVSIGQGEVLATPLQIANLSATIANRGYYITPHVVKAIEDTVMPAEYLAKHTPDIDRRWFEAVAEGMRMAVTGGTCTKANISDIAIAGKTGTAQNPHGKDHSAFMGFAPFDDPKIAVAVYVENGIWGATYGVPIGALIIEKYLTGKIRPERQYLETNMLNSSTLQNRVVRKPKTEQ